MIARQSVLRKPRVRDYPDIEPLPDPPQVPDMEQFDGIYAFAAAINPRFRREDGCLVSGGGYLRSSPEDMGDFAPDITFAKGVRDPWRIVRRNGYVISEVGKPPDLVLEVGSRSTGRRDYTVKRAGYARYGAREYWRFDPSGGDYHDAPIGGDALGDDGMYAPIEIVSESESRHWGYSAVLELEVWSYDGELRLRDPVSGEFLPTPNDSQDAVESERAARERAEFQAERERAARERAESQAEVERARAESERAARERAEAELRRLRGEG